MLKPFQKHTVGIRVNELFALEQVRTRTKAMWLPLPGYHEHEGTFHGHHEYFSTSHCHFRSPLWCLSEKTTIL